MDTQVQQTRAPDALLEGRFTGSLEFAALIRHACISASDKGWRDILICDADFSDWPLGEREVVQALHDWSATGRKLTMLAQNYNEVLRKHDRFVSWRRTWSHIVECRRCAPTPTGKMPSAFVTPTWCIERLDLLHGTGIAGSEAAWRVALRERINAQFQKSVPGFPSSTLGL